MKKLTATVTAAVCALVLALCLAACTGEADKPSDVTSSADAVAVVTDENIGEQTAQDKTEFEGIDSSEQEAESEPAESKAPEIVDISETEKRFVFYRGESKINGKVYLPQGSGPFAAVIISGGAGVSHTFYKDCAEAFVNEGIACVVFDYISNKNSTILTHVTDLNIVMDNVISMPELDSGRLFLWGHSFGGLTATYVAVQRAEDVKGMLLVEPAFEQNTRANELFASAEALELAGVKEQFVDDLKSFDILEMIPDYSAPVVIFTGNAASGMQEERDIFLAEVKKGADLFPSAEQIVIDGADHSFSGKAREPLMEKATAFVKENME